MKIHIADHPLITHKLTVLRDEKTDSPTFRRLTEEIVTLLAYEAMREVKTQPVTVKTPVAMAQGALKSFGTTWAIGTTGVAGPNPLDGHPVGMVWVAIAGPVCQSIELSLSGERESVRNAATASAIATFARILRHRA